MAEAALAAGVLGPARPRVAPPAGPNEPDSSAWSPLPMPSAPPHESPRARTDRHPNVPLVLAPSAASGHRAGERLGSSSATAASAHGDAAATAGVTASTVVHRAPTDRAVHTLQRDTGPSGTAEPAASPTDGPASNEPDLDQLADDVFDILRWRLAAERERALGWG